MGSGKVIRFTRALTTVLLLSCVAALVIHRQFLFEWLGISSKRSRPIIEYVETPSPRAIRAVTSGAGFGNGRTLPQTTEQSAGTGDEIIDHILVASGRTNQNMSGRGNNCGFYSILSQADDENFGGDALSPSGNAHSDAERHVKLLREKAETPGAIMLSSEEMPRISNYYNRPIVLIGDIGQIEISVPNDAGEEIRMIFFTRDLESNFKAWLTEYIGPRPEDLNNLLRSVREYSRGVNVDSGTILEVLMGMLRNPKTIGLLNVNGIHFHALQPLK
ncbi:MAG: hypothetical protein LBR91_02160 [Puniceicoccales bacterium]|jgi:hypothetical protein|nr:hypothetical protein [Puniceicoccales bacterium]